MNIHRAMLDSIHYHLERFCVRQLAARNRIKVPPSCKIPSPCPNWLFKLGCAIEFAVRSLKKRLYASTKYSTRKSDDPS